MHKRVFFPGSVFAFFGHLLLLFPFILGLGFLFTDIWWAIFFSPIASYALYASVLHLITLRVIYIKDGFISASPGYTPIDPVQHSIKIRLSDVITADFCIMNLKSYRMFNVPFLVLSLDNETTVSILLLGYTGRQFKELDEALSEANEDILFEHRSDYICQFHKYH